MKLTHFLSLKENNTIVRLAAVSLHVIAVVFHALKIYVLIGNNFFEAYLEVRNDAAFAHVLKLIFVHLLFNLFGALLISTRVYKSVNGRYFIIIYELFIFMLLLYIFPLRFDAVFSLTFIIALLSYGQYLSVRKGMDFGGQAHNKK